MWLYCVPTFRHDFDARANAVAIALGSAQSDIEPVAGLLAAVHPDLGVPADRGHHDVDASIAIQIAEGATAVAGREERRRSPASSVKRNPFSLASRIAETVLN